jgi:hypothetical protein
MAVRIDRAGRRGGRDLAREASSHLLCRPHTAETLAAALGVSPATVARALVELRRRLAREGGALVSVKEGVRWRYEIREREEDLWGADPFIRLIGRARGVRRPRGEGVDEALYGRSRGSR